VTGDWKSKDIGIESNIAEKMYIALQDNAGKKATVMHSNQAATTIGTWTEWNITLAEFAGVDLRTIKKMTIGVGDRTNPQRGGSGTLYIDDIRLNLPTPEPQPQPQPTPTPEPEP
jgi:hypothetical protein